MSDDIKSEHVQAVDAISIQNDEFRAQINEHVARMQTLKKAFIDNEAAARAARPITPIASERNP
jgi:predicted phage tail protein